MPTQNDFDAPPIYDQILNPNRPFYWDNVWVGYWTTFFQTLISYLSQNGIFLPQLTTAERDNLQTTSLVNGQLIYNRTVDAPQFWQTSSSSWRTIQFV